MSRPERPPWWPLFISLERAVGSRLEEATRSGEFAELLTRAARVNSALRATYLSATAGLLHRVNLPAWSDVRRLSDQVTALERRLDDVAVEPEAKPAAGDGVRRRSSRRRPRSSAR